MNTDQWGNPTRDYKPPSIIEEYSTAKSPVEWDLDQFECHFTVDTEPSNSEFCKFFVNAEPPEQTQNVVPVYTQVIGFDSLFNV